MMGYEKVRPFEDGREFEPNSAKGGRLRHVLPRDTMHPRECDLASGRSDETGCTFHDPLAVYADQSDGACAIGFRIRGFEVDGDEARFAGARMIGGRWWSRCFEANPIEKAGDGIVVENFQDTTGGGIGMAGQFGTQTLCVARRG